MFDHGKKRAFNLVSAPRKAAKQIMVCTVVIIPLAGLAAPPARAQSATTPVDNGRPSSTNGPFSSNVNTSGAITPTKANPLDLNGASEAELAALPGVGTARAKAIVGGRPYQETDELVRRQILPQDVYNHMQGLVVAKQR